MDKSQQVKRWIVPALLALILVVAIVVVLIRGRGTELFTVDDAVPPLGYAEGVTVVNDPNALQNAVDEMYKKAAEGNMALEYSNEANSKNGKTFTCYIANSERNTYDMYIDVYADQALTDEVYLSGLIRPGYALRELELKKALPAGTNTVYVAFTQVEEDHTTAHGQILVTMDFTVTK